jgi:GTP-binding protein of the ras superfamily involved in termination of M-phase
MVSPSTWIQQGISIQFKRQTAIPFLIGTKYDQFATFPREEQEEITKQARKYSKAMKAPLIFCSTSHGINVQKIFKIVLSRAFDLKVRHTA